MRIRILLVTFKRILIRILVSKIKAQNLKKVLKKAHIPYFLACHLQIYADPDPAYHFDADPDPDPAYHFDADADRDPDPTLHSDADPCGSGSTTLTTEKEINAFYGGKLTVV
jgi:hypothetical protein